MVPFVSLGHLFAVERAWQGPEQVFRRHWMDCYTRFYFGEPWLGSFVQHEVRKRISKRVAFGHDVASDRRKEWETQTFFVCL